ncbi:MAG: hypothetical protein PW788_15435 [Micavibrio sp.]|nr:hypothetical protein [Micavibrio sp.]
MKLSKLFQSDVSALIEAVENSDTKALESLRKTKNGFLSLVVTRMDFGKISAEMADIFVNKFTAENWERWGFREDSRDVVVSLLFSQSLLQGRTDLFDTYMNAGLALNSGKASGHPVNYVLTSKELKPDVKAALTQKLLGAGINNVSDTAQWLATAVKTDALDAFDLLAKAIPADLHKNNEELLRDAARAGQTEMCRHLVEKHGCDIDLAISTDRTLGVEASWVFLAALREDIKPGEKAPATLESLSAEVNELRAAVRQLTARVNELQSPTQTIEKPLLSRPKVLP